MSQRLITEMSRSTQQVIGSLQRKVHYLDGNVGAGAVRSAQLDSSNDPGSTPATLLSLELSMGRWIVMWRASIAGTNTPGEVYAMRAIVPAMAEGVLPQSNLRIPGTGVFTFPMSEIGEFRNEEPASIQLQAWHTSANTVTWTGVSLFCLPV